MDLGKSIKIGLINRDMPQGVLAGRTGICKSHLSAMANGHKLPNMVMLESIATKLDYKVSEFIALGETN